MTTKKRSQRISVAGEVARWKDQHDALLTVLNAILLAYGSGPEARIAVANAYYRGAQRRNVRTEQMLDGILIYLEPTKIVTKEDTDAPSQEVN